MKKLVLPFLLIITSLFALNGANINNITANNTSKDSILIKTVSQKGFTWGADIGSSIDMSGNDMSSVDVGAYFGYRNSWIRTVGAGAAIHSSLGNNNTFIPIYAIFRSSFTSKPSLCFVDIKCGYSFNNLGSVSTQSGFFGGLGVGFNLYSNSKFKSHIILAYNYFKLKPYNNIEKPMGNDNLQTVAIHIGISF